jgi:3-oxoacyl-[acyl-carrier-protein] synthase-3
MSDAACGVRIIGSGSATPSRVLSNDDLAQMMETSDEWIVKRTGIRERRISDQESEGAFTLACEAMSRAIDDAQCTGSDLDLLINASVSSEMTCPSNACRIAAEVGAVPAGAFDLVAACSGFVYALNVADIMIRSGRYNRIGVIGSDAMSTIVDYDDRSVSILFGDAAGAVVVERCDDPAKGCRFQTMQADGSDWGSLYLPRRQQEIVANDGNESIKLGCLRMNGREVYRFAVNKFRDVILEALEATGLAVNDVAQYICHQSNARIIQSAIDKIGLPPDRVKINIDRYGNTSAGSVGLVFNELWKQGAMQEGDTIVFVAFGGGLTWASCVWQM